MQRHLLVESTDLPPRVTQPDAELGFLAGDQCGIKPVDAGKGCGTHYGVTATGRAVANRSVPLEVAEIVVDGGVREAFAPPPASHRVVLVRGKKLFGCRQPIGDDLAVSIDEHDELHVGHERL